MPAREISFQKGFIYHLLNRGAGRQSIFIRPADYHYVTFKLEEYLEKLELSMIAYSLLPNHFHFVVRQDGEIDTRELPKRLFGGYSRTMATRYGWSGTIFEGRFKSYHVDTEEYLKNVCRYVHSNPVGHGFVEAPGEWFYSNYHEWINPQTEDPTIREFRNGLFGTVESYKTFLRDPRYPPWFKFPEF